MAYRTVLVHVDLAPQAAARIHLACAAARLAGAHLIGAAMAGLERFRHADPRAGPEHSVLRLQAEQLHHRAEQALAQCAALADAAGVPSFERRLIDDDEQSGLIRLAPCCDLVVLSQSDPDLAPPGASAHLPTWVVVQAARPVLVAPFAAPPGSSASSGPTVPPARLDGHALVAWNGSIQAARALRDALPLLARAHKVTLAHIGVQQESAFSGQAGDLLAWLGRHGVRAVPLERIGGADDGVALVSLAIEQRADLIVMGAYGRSPWRERMLGGVTRSVLRSMTMPVLMSH